MKVTAGLIAAGAALGVTMVAFGQSMTDGTPQPQPGQQNQSSDTPLPPPPSEVTTVQQPISGNSTATNAPNSMAPNAGEANTRLAALVPQGMSMKEACDGFKTTNECVAALHLSQNLGIPFRQLKSKVSGGERLTEAVHTLKPGADANREVDRAQQQARSDIQSPQG
jgi:hypothetical protein